MSANVAAAQNVSDQAEQAQVELEYRKLELERYKARLDFRKFVLASVFAAIVIAAIPPAFQFATAHLEYVKSQAQLRIDQQNREAERVAKEEEFRETYIKNFLTNALNQDIELRIRFAEYFSFVSGENYRKGWADFHDSLVKHRNTIRSNIDNMESQWQSRAEVKGLDDPEVKRIVRNLTWSYKEVGYVETIRSVAANPRVSDTTQSTVAASDVRNACEQEFEVHKSDTSAFVQAVAADFGVKLVGTADEIVDSVQRPPWQVLKDGASAAEYARNGYLVIAGLKGSDQQVPAPQGHLAIIVDGPANRRATGTYPSAYWGRLGGGGQKFQTINWAWTADDRDRVIYSALKLQAATAAQ
jgi:hypothetical protein